jgi:hypothetical protein
MDKLEELFQRIHDNVYSHSLLSDQPKLPSFTPDLLERITALRNSQAPYYVVSGNPLTRLVKKVHNLVLKLFGRKQAYYNNLNLDLLESTTVFLQALQEHNKTQASRIESLTRQVMLQTEELSALQAEYQKLVSTIEQIAPQWNTGNEVEARDKKSASQPDENL